MWDNSNEVIPKRGRQAEMRVRAPWLRDFSARAFAVMPSVAACGDLVLHGYFQTTLT
jgi:hypothetical protein